MPDVISRAAVYFDGFNMYHSIDDIGQAHLKWLDLYKLSKSLLTDKNEHLMKVVYCSAFYPRDERKTFRHQQYINALTIRGVVFIKGHFIDNKHECGNCGAKAFPPNEKASDINLALSVIEDGQNNVYDKAYLVSNDSDQVATVQFFKRMFPSKTLIIVTPPGREPSAHLTGAAHQKLSINPSFLEHALFEELVVDPMGFHRAGRRPREYAPPANWVHPAQRPKLKIPKAAM